MTKDILFSRISVMAPYLLSLFTIFRRRMDAVDMSQVNAVVITIRAAVLQGHVKEGGTHIFVLNPGVHLDLEKWTPASSGQKTSLDRRRASVRPVEMPVPTEVKTPTSKVCQGHRRRRRLPR